MNKLRWYMNRFSLMSPSEIFYRTKMEIRKNSEKYFIPKFQTHFSLKEEKVNYYFEPQDRDKISNYLKKNKLWNEEKAEQLLNHKFSFFSFKKKFLGDAINWHLDYKNHKQAPLKYSKSIDYREFDEVGDIKYIWEINRHQHLIILAKAYYITGDESYKEEVKKQIVSWIESNPYMKGVNWQSSLEVALRLISWSWVWFFLGGIEDEFRKIWLESIYRHCVFTARNFSQYSSANNHLIGEASGLFISSIVWPFAQESEKWRRKSYDILTREIERQNYADGVNKEQAVSYQQFVLDFFLLAGILGEKNGIKFSDGYWSRVEKMIEFIASIMDKSGRIPDIGDSDDGYAVVLSESPDFNGYRSLVATGAVLFNRGDFKSRAALFDQKSLWLLGFNSARQFKDLPGGPFVSTKNFENGGYYVLSDSEGTEKEIKAVFDCGPLGYLRLAAHGHADALSFTLSAGGKKFIIDSGTYTYHTQKNWREYFRGTSAHNTLRIDKKNQSVSGGNFMWIKKAKPGVIDRKSDHKIDFVKGGHDGYMRLKDPVKHQREILLDKSKRTLDIIDEVKANRRHTIEQFFHFSKECVVEKLDKREWKVLNKDVVMCIKLDNKLEVNMYKGSTDPVLGWQSETFDVKTPVHTMVGRLEWEGSCELKTAIKIKDLEH